MAEDIFARALHLILPIHFLKLEAAQIGRMTELPSFVSWEQQGVYHLQVNNTKLLFKQICIHSLDRNAITTAMVKFVIIQMYLLVSLSLSLRNTFSIKTAGYGVR